MVVCCLWERKQTDSFSIMYIFINKIYVESQVYGFVQKFRNDINATSCTQSTLHILNSVKKQMTYKFSL